MSRGRQPELTSPIDLNVSPSANNPWSLMYLSECEADLHSMESLTSASDGALVSASQSGSQLAFSELCRRHSPMASRSIFRIVRNDQDTQDVLQDTLMKAFLHIRRFENRCSFSTWLTRIAINSALMVLRKRRAGAMVSIDDDLEDLPKPYKEIVELSLNPESSYIDGESRIAIYRNVGCLPPQLRSIVELKYSNELSLREIADKEGLSVAAVKSRLMRGRRALKNRIKSKAHITGCALIDSRKPMDNARAVQL